MSSGKPYPPLKANGDYVGRPVVSKHRILATRAIRTFFEQQIEPVAQQIVLLIGLNKVADPDRQAGDAADQVNIDWRPLAEEVEPYLAIVAVAGGELAVEQLDNQHVGDDFGTGMRVRAGAWARQRAAELVGMRREGDFYVPNPDARFAIDSTTRDMLRAEVRKAIEGGDSTDDLVKRLKRSFAFSHDRARMIARTEIARADSEGALIGWAQSGVVNGKSWLTVGDDKVSKPCLHNQGVGVVALDWDYGDGVLAPPQHPNCRCAVLPEVVDLMELPQ